MYLAHLHTSAVQFLLSPGEYCSSRTPRTAATLSHYVIGPQIVIDAVHLQYTGGTVPRLQDSVTFGPDRPLHLPLNVIEPPLSPLFLSLH
jgi:hypothetical protein